MKYVEQHDFGTFGWAAQVDAVITLSQEKEDKV